MVIVNILRNPILIIKAPILYRECKTLRAPYFSVKTLFSMSFYYKNLQSSWFA